MFNRKEGASIFLCVEAKTYFCRKAMLDLETVHVLKCEFFGNFVFLGLRAQSKE